MFKAAVVVVVACVAAWGAYKWFDSAGSRDRALAAGGRPDTKPADQGPIKGPRENRRADTRPTSTPAPQSASPAATRPRDDDAGSDTGILPPPWESAPEQLAQAQEARRKGLDLLAADNLIGAREQLSDALSSGLLPEVDTADCRTRLTAIAEKVVFSRDIFPDDTRARKYVIKPGDKLVEIVKREQLDVPHEGIQRINKIDPAKLIPGQTLKLIQGPFDVIITKHTYTLDLYNHGMFVKSYRIGLGQNGSTPTGRWIVSQGGRVRSAPWTPPPTAGQTGTLYPGQPGYPLGKDGLWIALQGADKRTEMLSGFGIHGTNEPDSIGRDASLGCIRLGDNDIAELFAMLCDGKSQVLVRP
jgi:lipoprotein-anchoring transpeptidase ErfK/SrfK